MLLPDVCPHSVGVIAQNCRQRVKVPAVIQGCGQWLQMTTVDKCITVKILNKNCADNMLR